MSPRVIAAVTLSAIAGGVALAIAGDDSAARAVWGAAVALALIPLTVSVVAGRRGSPTGARTAR